MAKKLKLAKGNKPAAKQAEAPAKSKKTAKKEGTRKYAGRTSGLPVTEFQNKLMKDNFKAKLTDEQLAQAMRNEFPDAIQYTTGHVVGIRSGWNNGKRAGQEGVAPEKKLPRFNDDGSSTVETRGRGGKAKAAKKAAAVAPPAKAKPIKKVPKAKAPVEEEEDIEDDILEDEEE